MQSRWRVARINRKGKAIAMQGLAAKPTPETVQGWFTRSDGAYLFARWGRPIVPVVFGLEQATLEVVKGAIEAVVLVAGHKMAATDPELGANLLMFFVREWDELAAVAQLEAMLPGIATLCLRLKAGGANQYRLFHHDATGAIKTAFVFLRLDTHLEAVSADALALTQAVLMILLWSDAAFKGSSPLAVLGGRVIVRPEIAAVIRASYDPVLPAVARDASHALRLAARVTQQMGGRSDPQA